MRLHRLVLTAFGPFADTQEIDFDRLTASGLFLLEGPTGAGKTSVLDAVTFALYGGLSSGSAGADRLHSHFAAPTVEPSVELEFSVRGVRHRVRRTPEWQRPSRRRVAAMTTQRASVHLERWAPGGWESLSSAKAEVGEIIGELLGLNREQFAQVVLLPQGEFATFLRANDDERRQLLTKLFDALLYDEITDELTHRRAAAQLGIERAAACTRDRLSAVGEAAGLDSSAREALLTSGFEARAEALDRLGGQLLRMEREALEHATRCDLELGTAQQRQEAAAAAWQGAERLRSAEAALRAHHETRADAERDRTVVLDARRAAPVRPLLAQADERSAVVDRLRISIFGGAAGASAGSDAADGVADVTVEIGPLRERAQAWRDEASQLVAAAQAEGSLSALRDEYTGAQLAADAADKQVARLEDRRQELPELVARASRHREEARDAVAALPGLRARSQQLAERLVAARALQAVTAQVERERAEQLRATEIHQRAVDQHQQAMQARLDGLAGELAGHLRAGEPCAVCGATSHPAPATVGPGAVDAVALDRAARARRKAEVAREQIDAECSALVAEQAGWAARAGNEPAGALEADGQRADSILRAAEALAETLAETEARLTEREVERDRWQAARARAGTDAALARTRTGAAADRLGVAEQIVEAARAGHPSITARQAALLAAADTAERRAETMVELDRASAEEGAARQRAEHAAAAAGFRQLADVRRAERTPAELADIERRLTEWEQLEGRLRATLAAARTARTTDGPDSALGREVLDPVRLVEEVRRTEVAAHDARSATLTAEAALRVARSHADATASASVRFVARAGEWRQAEQIEADVRQRGAGVVHSAALARGMAGHRRTTLTTYVLRHWFERVIAAANTRLGSMSSGRYALVRTDSGVRASERTGLGLRVVDQHTGEQRGAASMSGGETFYTSLALALGLADVVSAEAGGVELDTLFIDEGFGSLDPETLDQVMGVIDELRENGRVIGIVSHVTELKERVQERVAVRRREDGASTLTVLA